MLTTAWQPQGLLNPPVATTTFTLQRLPPARALTALVERYWFITWDRRGEEPYHAQTLPQPYVNLVFEAHQTRVYGVASKKSTNCLADRGWVFGVKFKPGAFYPFLQQPLVTLTDQSLPIEALFGEVGQRLAQLILAQQDPAAMCAVADDFWAARLPAPDANLVLVGAIVEHIMADRTILKVDDVAQHFGLSRRTLQRLFHRYVGVSPKWVISRYRLHDAAEQLAQGWTLGLAAMAQELGYFDQAHFIKEFKAVIGLSPTEYARSVAWAV